MESEIFNLRQDMQIFWSFTRTLTPEKPQSNVPDLVQNRNGVNITEPDEIAESCNKYCTFVV